MNSQDRYIFHGDWTQASTTRHPDSPSAPEPYVASDGLIEAVNLALHLRRPLLLEGEAGCGKTRLAYALAYELGLPLYTWHVRSTSKAVDGLYMYDAVLRLHDVQVMQAENLAGMSAPFRDEDMVPRRDPRRPQDYRRLGPLGKAFTLRDWSAVVLIDEVDKADIDFPNDLLAVLDAPWSFEIPETGETIAASESAMPIVVVTSNKEKGNLPIPFLRRCVYYFLEFPDEELLNRIVDVHYEVLDTPSPPGDLVAAAIQRFISLYRDGGLYKRPGTSEFLDWLHALEHFGSRPDYAEGLTTSGALPFPELLLKLRADWQRHVHSA